MRSPFSLFMRKGVWYARFWNEESQSYRVTRSTEIPAGPRRKGVIEAASVAEELADEISRNLDPFFLDYVSAFWADDGNYAQGKRIADRKPLSVEYLENNRRAIRLHVSPFPRFKGLTLSRLKAGIVEDWKIWALKSGTGARTVNYALQAVKVAVHTAVMRGDLPSDPLRAVKPVAVLVNEKGVLSPSETARLVQVKESDIRVHSAVLFAAFCGMRRGEIRGLRWGDIDEGEGVVYVRHNWIDEEGDKTPKAGSARRVFLPDELRPILESLRGLFPSAPEAFVHPDLFDPEKPISETVLKRGYWRVLKAIGIDAEARKARRLTLHSLRHGFITNARSAGLPDITVQALAGHKSGRMMEHYSHGAQVIDLAEARRALEKAVSVKAANE